MAAERGRLRLFTRPEEAVELVADFVFDYVLRCPSGKIAGVVGQFAAVDLGAV